MSFSAKWQKFQRLSLSEKWMLFVAMIVLPVTATGIRLFGIKRWKAFLARLSPFRANRVMENTERAQNIAWLVTVAAWNGPYRANCLQRSLTLWWLLRRRGIESDLKIGMQAENGEVRGHAWIEYGGIVLNDSEDVGDHYHTFKDLETNLR
jgi:hypothetical protein